MAETVGDHVRASLPTWLEADRTARALIDADRTPLWMNGPAKTILRTRRDLRLIDGAIQVTDPEQAEAFERQIRQATNVPTSWCYASLNRARGIVFVIQRLSSAKGAQLVGLTFHTAGPDFEPKWADFSKVFELTPMEFKILCELLQGRGVEAAAHRLGISTETARTHVRNAYAKMRVSSREEMFKALAPYRFS